MYCKMACIYIRRIMKVLHIYIRCQYHRYRYNIDGQYCKGSLDYLFYRYLYIRYGSIFLKLVY